MIITKIDSHNLKWLTLDEPSVSIDRDLVSI